MLGLLRHSNKGQQVFLIGFHSFNVVLSVDTSYNVNNNNWNAIISDDFDTQSNFAHCKLLEMQ